MHHSDLSVSWCSHMIPAKEITPASAFDLAGVTTRIRVNYTPILIVTNPNHKSYKLGRSSWDGVGGCTCHFGA